MRGTGGLCSQGGAGRSLSIRTSPMGRTGVPRALLFLDDSASPNMRLEMRAVMRCSAVALAQALFWTHFICVPGGFPRADILLCEVPACFVLCPPTCAVRRNGMNCLQLGKRCFGCGSVME